MKWLNYLANLFKSKLKRFALFAVLMKCIMRFVFCLKSALTDIWISGVTHVMSAILNR